MFRKTKVAQECSLWAIMKFWGISSLQGHIGTVSQHNSQGVNYSICLYYSIIKFSLAGENNTQENLQKSVDFIHILNFLGNCLINYRFYCAFTNFLETCIPVIHYLKLTLFSLSAGTTVSRDRLLTNEREGKFIVEL